MTGSVSLDDVSVYINRNKDSDFKNKPLLRFEKTGRLCVGVPSGTTKEEFYKKFGLVGVIYTLESNRLVYSYIDSKPSSKFYSVLGLNSSGVRKNFKIGEIIYVDLNEKSEVVYTNKPPIKIGNNLNNIIFNGNINEELELYTKILLLQLNKQGFFDTYFLRHVNLRQESQISYKQTTKAKKVDGAAKLVDSDRSISSDSEYILDNMSSSNNSLIEDTLRLFNGIKNGTQEIRSYEFFDENASLDYFISKTLATLNKKWNTRIRLTEQNSKFYIGRISNVDNSGSKIEK